MIYAFSPSGLARLESLRGQQILFAFDFDGTLAPIVPDPRGARMAAVTRKLLEKLAARGTVAAVSGRPVRELRALVPPSFAACAGDHGAEILPRRFQRFRGLGRARALVKGWDRQLARLLPSLPGVWVERKELSLTIHFRHSPRPGSARGTILRAVAGIAPGPRILPGKSVVNLMVPGIPHKGDAVRTLMQGFGRRHALYVGDDSNDEDVFALADPCIRTLRVGRLSGSRASLYLKRQSEINRLLRLLLSLQGERAPSYRGRREKNRALRKKAPVKSPQTKPEAKAVDRHRSRRNEDRGRGGGRRRTNARRAQGAHRSRRLARAS
jgi:trehalose 6-phosphate phosphatase